MNLISCGGCGVVLDKDKLDFSYDPYATDEGIDMDRVHYTRDGYILKVPCPVCKGNILDDKHI